MVATMNELTAIPDGRRRKQHNTRHMLRVFGWHTTAHRHRRRCWGIVLRAMRGRVKNG